MNSDGELLIARLFSGKLSAADARRLNPILSSNAALRALYRQQMEMHALLQWRSGNVNRRGLDEIDPISIAELLQEADEAAQRQMREEAAERVRQDAAAAERQRRIEELQQRHVRRPEPIVIPYSVVYLGAGALAASLLWIAFTLFPAGDAQVAVQNSQPVIRETPPTPPIAVLVDALQAQLMAVTENGTDHQITPVSTIAGTPLASGRYRLVEGVVGLKFNEGVNVVLEAPATVELKAANRLRVVRGRLVGQVPPQAIGFAVETPTATILDLGTEFGVAVPDGQEVDVTVFDGEVEVLAAAPGDRSDEESAVLRQRLTENSSVRVDDQGSFSAAETKAELYFRKIPSLEEYEQKRAYERWLVHSKQIAADSDVIAYFAFDDQAPDDTLLLNRAGEGGSLNGEIRGAEWTEGRWPLKQALRFGAGDITEKAFDHVKLDIPGRFETLTLAAWVNADLLLEGHNGILMTETWDQPGQVHWQILQDGRLHVGLAGNSNGMTGETYDSQGFINLGVWNHVAVVIDRQESQLSFFINGANVGSVAVSIADALRLGPLNLGDWKRSDESAGRGVWQALHGRMDELLVLDRAMSEQEIQALYEAGKPGYW